MTTAATSTVPSDSPLLLQCAEVWGGNDPVERGVVMQGLDAWVYAEPCDSSEAGGDIHYLTSCATGRITRMLVADVAGHGTSVAPIAKKLRALVRRFMNYVDQSKLVEGINQEFSQLTKDGRFATAIIGTYWAPTGQLDLTCAGHPPPMIFSAASGKWTLLDAAGTEKNPSDIPLGIIEESSYAVIKTSLRAGDMVMLYTDALIEAKDQQGDLLTFSRLVEILNSIPHTEPEAIPGRILRSIRERNYSIDDDVTMLLVRPNSLSKKASIANGIAAGWRVSRVFLASLFSGSTGGLPQLRRDNILGAWFARFNK